jgi:positive regulator of sigma E activity
MEPAEEIRSPESPQESRKSLSPGEKSQLEIFGRPLPLLGGSIFVFVGLTALVLLVVTLDSHRRNLLLGFTALFLAFMFGFAALIVRSYNRDKKKLDEQNPYRNDHVVH